jgi:hypothetical protein
MRYSKMLLIVAGLALTAACSHSDNSGGEATSASATVPAATAEASSDAATSATASPESGTTAAPAPADSGSTTFTTGNGSMTIGSTIDTSKLGVPVYPGAKVGKQGSVQATTAKGSTLAAEFETDDSFDKVYAYYKSQLPSDAEKLKTTSGDKSMCMFSTKVDNDQVMVELTTGDSGGTNVIISRGPAK